MSASSKSVTAGPAEPGSPTGELVTWVEVGSTKLLFQSYEDGRLWQLQAPKGSPFHPSVFAEIPRKGVWMDVFNPADVNEDDRDEFLYLSVWVPN